jgi:hypothetical protein
MSDVVGAFDHVDARILIARFEQLGLKGIWSRLLCNILAPRRAAVVVAGVECPIFPIKNPVYQGTVLGPPLWKVFFKPAASIVKSSGLDPFAFADDLNAMALFPNSTPSEEVLVKLRACQLELHEWGRTERLQLEL